MVRVTGARALPQASVAVHVSVIVPPHAPAGACTDKVERFDIPLIRHTPVSPFEYVKVLGVGTAPQATVISAGADITGKVAGLIVIVLVTGARTLPQASVAVHVSVTVPPHASAGIAEKVEASDVPLIRQAPDPPLV